MSTFCISEINWVEVLTNRVSRETYGKENVFTFLLLIWCIWKYKKSVVFLHIQTSTPIVDIRQINRNVNVILSYVQKLMERKENTFNLVSKLYLFEENIKGDISKYQNIIGTRYITTFEGGGGGGGSQKYDSGDFSR